MYRKEREGQYVVSVVNGNQLFWWRKRQFFAWISVQIDYMPSKW